MTNNYKAGKLAIQKCDKCRDGYLIVKQGQDQNFFLGCSNYKRNGTGCSRMLSKQAYYSMMGYKLEESESVSSGAYTGSGYANTDFVTITTTEPVVQKKVVSQENPTQIESTPVNKWNSARDDYVEIIKADIEPVIYKNKDLNDVIYTILKALQNVSRIKFFGVTVLCDVLRGAETERIYDNQLNNIPEYGACREYSIEDVRTIVEWIISEHYILQTKGNYPVLHSTYDGLHYAETITKRRITKLQKLLMPKEE